MSGPVRPRRDSVEAVHEIAGRIVAWIVLAGAVLLPVAHSLGIAERIHLTNESLLPIGLGILAFFYLAVVYGQKRIEEQFEQFKTSNGPHGADWAEKIKLTISKDLHEIFEPEIDRSCQMLRRAVVDREFVIKNVLLPERFSAAYGRILKRFPYSTFYATAPAKRQYWKVFRSNSEGTLTVVDEFKRFLDGGAGAAMKRIFFVEDPLQLTLEECEIILPQARILTATYIASIHTVRELNCLRYVAVEAMDRGNPRLSWEVQTDGFEVLQVVTSLDRDKAREFLSDWDRIVQLFPLPVTVDQVTQRIAELDKASPVSSTTQPK